MPPIICLIAIAFGSGIGGWFMLPGWQWGGFVAVLLLVLAVGAARDGRFWLLLAFVIMAAASFGYWRAEQRTEQVRAPVLEKRLKAAWVTGNVEDIEKTEKGWRILVSQPSIADIEPQKTPAFIRVTVKEKPEDIEKNDAIRFLATLFPPSPAVMPGAFDFSRHAYYQQLGAVGYAMSKPKRLGGSEGAEESGLSDKITAARDFVASRFNATMIADNAAVAAAMLVGKQEQVSQPVLESMQQAGILHIISISGLHMAMVTAFVFLLIRRGLVIVPYFALHLPLKKIASFIALIAASAYLALSGAPVPAERAFIMAALVLLAIMLDRQIQPIRLVAIAAIAVLFIQPESLLTASFQLSFAATTALVAYFEYRRTENAGANKMMFAPLRYLVAIAASSAVASIATMPFSLYHFGNASISGLLANMLAIPLTSLVTMPAGVVALLAMPLGWDELPIKLLDWSLGWLLDISAFINEHAALVLHISPPEWFALAGVVYGGLLFIFLHKYWRLTGLAVAASAWLAGLWLAETPLLLVEEQYAAINLKNGSWLLLDHSGSGQTPKPNWVTRQWQQRLTGEFVTESDSISCDGQGCVVDSAAGIIAFSATQASLADDCANADLVLTANMPDNGCEAFIVQPENEKPLAIFKTDSGFRVWP